MKGSDDGGRRRDLWVHLVIALVGLAASTALVSLGVARAKLVAPSVFALLSLFFVSRLFVILYQLLKQR